MTPHLLPASRQFNCFEWYIYIAYMPACTNSNSTMITYDDFLKADIRSGTILEALPFPRAKKPAYRLRIDFGELGVLVSSAQITDHYTLDELPGKQVVAVVNFPPKQIADFISQCLVLGVVQADQSVVLLEPGIKTGNGLRIL